MRVFVTGATGVIGRELLPQLLAAGHGVVGLARTPEKLLQVAKTGATPVRGDVLNAADMARVVGETRPEAIVNLATAIPLKLRVDLKDWQGNDQVREEGTRNLLTAAQSAGSVRLFVQESVGYVCASQGENWMDEAAPRTTNPFLAATIAMEKLVESSPVPHALLRFAALTSAESWHTQQMLPALRRGLLPIIGDGKAFFSLIHAYDAAQAIVAALAAPETANGQIYNVTDNEPAPAHEVLPYAAKLLNVSAPRHVPPFMAKMVVGALTVDVLTASYRMTNAKIRRELGFTPRYPTYRENWRQIVGELGGKEIAASDDLNV